MTAPDAALLLAALAGLGLRAAGLVLGGALGAEHAFVRWAAAVSVATLACFVALAIAVPGGLLAEVPLAARLAGTACGAAAYLLAGQRLLPALLAGLAGLSAAWAAFG